MREKSQNLSSEERLLDFIAFVLIEYPFIKWYGESYFSQKRMKQFYPDCFQNFKANYQHFLKEDLGIVISDLSLSETQSGIATLNLILSMEQANIINKNLKRKFNNFDNEVENRKSIGRFSFDITREELQRYFSDYMQLYKLNPNVWISYYSIQIKHLEKKGQVKLLNYRKEIKEIHSRKRFVDLKLWMQYLAEKKRGLENNLYRSLEEVDFQLSGFFDEKGGFIENDRTLQNYLFYIKNNPNFLPDYSFKSFDVEDSIAYLKIKLFEEELSITSKNFFDSPELQKLSAEWGEVEKDWKELTVFLLSKDFDYKEIEFVINTLYNEKFTPLGIRSFKVRHDVQVFHIWYLFGLFDFYKEVKGQKLISYPDFQIVFDFQDVWEKDEDENLDDLRTRKSKQIRRYYLGKKNPFSTIGDTIDVMTGKFGIARGKLNIPKALR